MIHSFVHAFAFGFIALLLIWAALVLLGVTAVQYLRGMAPRVPLATGALAAACFTAGASVSYLT